MKKPAKSKEGIDPEGYGAQPNRNENWVTTDQVPTEGAGTVSEFALSAGAASNTVDGAPSIAEQARSLRHDVDLIYQFVHDNIDFIPTYGWLKGGWGALVDGSANPIDQCDLMVKLLNEQDPVNPRAKYVLGTILLEDAQWSSWLGVSTSEIGLASQLLTNGGIENQQVSGNKLRIAHYWVQVKIDGIDYVFDPSLKNYSYTNGIDLQAALQYDRSTFLAAADSGSVMTPDYVRNINEPALVSKLAQSSINLVDWINQNNPDATLDEILGGRSIVPILESPPTRYLQLPYQENTPPSPFPAPTPIVALSGNLKGAITINFSEFDIYQTFLSADIYGKRLTLWFDASNVARLYLDGVLKATSSAQTPGENITLELSMGTPYGSSDTQTIWVKTGYSVAIGTAWGPRSRNMAAVHQRSLQEFIAQNIAATDERTLGTSLTMMWDNYVGQSSQGADFIGRMSKTQNVIHFMGGIVVSLPTPSGPVTYVNFPLAQWTNNPLVSDLDTKAADFATSMLASMLEGPCIEQVSGVASASLTAAVQMVNAEGKEIYNGTAANWSTISPILQSQGGWGTVVDDIYYRLIDRNPSWRAIVPNDATLQLGNLQNFWGYLGLNPNGRGIWGRIWFDAKGGTATLSQTAAGTNTAAANNSPLVNGFGVPGTSSSVDAQLGRFVNGHSDISVGSQSEPYGLSLERSYNSDLRLVNQGLGFGWSHSYICQARQSSDGFIAFGDQRTVCAAPAIAALFVTLDIVASSPQMPINRFVTLCLVQQWLAGWLVNNTALVQMGGRFEIFAQIPDKNPSSLGEGTFVPGIGIKSNIKLVIDKDTGTFKYTTPQKVVYRFNADGNLSSISYPFGMFINLSYNATTKKLTSVTNGVRTLTFSYDVNGQLSSVSDGNGRSVQYTVDNASGHLSVFKDALLKQITYQYDATKRGLLTKIFLPANAGTAVVENIYDTLQRLKQQKDAYGNVWNLYFAGNRSESVDPDNKSNVAYFNSRGSVIRVINQLGKETKIERDGLDRQTKVILAEKNGTSFSYDINDNVTSMMSFAKPPSAAVLTTTYTYDPIWDKVETITDPMGRIATFAYDLFSGMLTESASTPLDGVPAVARYFYNSFGLPVEMTDATGRRTISRYDPINFNLLFTMVDPQSGSIGLGLTTSFAYDSVGNAISVTDAMGNVTTSTYDSNRRITQTTEPQPFGGTSNFVYDDNGNTLQVRRLNATDALTSVVVSTYGIDGRVLTTTEPLNNVQGRTPKPSVNTYDALGRIQKAVDPVGRVCTYSYDAMGRTVTVNQDGVATSTTTYSDNGQIATVADSKNNTTSYIYDAFDRLEKTTFPDLSFESYTHDDAGNVTLIATRGGGTIDLTYDALNRLKTKHSQGQALFTYAYDLAGRLLSVSTPPEAGDPSTGLFEQLYDGAGRLYQEKLPDLLTVTSELDKNGNVTKLTYPDGTHVTAGFDQLNRLTSLQDSIPGRTQARFTYDALSRLAGFFYPTIPAGMAYSYDKSNNLLSLSIRKPATGSQSLGLQTLSFTYNDVHQQKSRNSAGGDLVWAPSSGSVVNYGTADSMNCYPSVGGVSFTYNNEGCLTSDGVLTYAYNLDNQLVSVVGTGVNVTFKYDPLGRLTVKDVEGAQTRYVYAGKNRIAEYEVGNVTARYVYGASGNVVSVYKDSLLTYLFGDERGSVILTSNSDQPRRYTPWGELDGGALDGINIGFGGQFYEAEIGLYLFGARFYSPKLGRFLQPDPLSYGGGSNLYEFANGDPINQGDASGLDSTSNTLVLTTGIELQVKYQAPKTPAPPFNDSASHGSAGTITGAGQANAQTIGGSGGSGMIPIGYDAPPPGMTYIYVFGIGYVLMGASVYDQAAPAPQPVAPPPRVAPAWTRTGANPGQMLRGFSAGFGPDRYDLLSTIDTFNPWVMNSVGFGGAAYGLTEVYGASKAGGRLKGSHPGPRKGRPLWEEWTDYSHWRPARDGGPTSIWNGNEVNVRVHAMSDPEAYKFAPKYFKEQYAAPWPLVVRQFARIPLIYIGIAIGRAYQYSVMSI
jgi:RHS repeat-associated protein